ncbi:FAD-dependent oxidoreductase [Blastococcus brunescens]|uniref:Pyridine nucleotide-disulfide oxidoreductase domain-containing protein 2 n=1 Tax=Blastococcus brunescens TaxID=1564165 RepID=A0ABZ1AY94_9ACTN|nr:FAD-dependent oxidoreductase [Blastococcus sp. BMG 8361]WRL63434.1 FAD-dependent oxidoreductase [Blastococcus sp. BMG 8361]
MVADHLTDDVVRGIALTDGLIGTFADVHDADGPAGRCFLYHLVGNGTGRWRVPVGGMGAVSGAMAAAARRGGAEIVPRATVTAVDATAAGVTVHWTDGDGGTRAVDAGHVVCGAAPSVLAELIGSDPGPRPSGSQLKVNMVLARLPGCGRARIRRPRSPAPSTSTRGRPDRRRLRAGRGRRAPRRHPVRGLLPLAERPVRPRAGRAGHRDPHADAVRPAHAGRALPCRPRGHAPGGGAPRGGPARRAPRGAAAGLPRP